MGMSGLELNFAATENYNTSYTGADKATVEYSTDGGTTWVAVSDYFRENTTLTSAATYNLRNNIFVTARTGGSGIHSALRLPALTSGSLSGLTCNYNAFNGVVLVYEGTISRTTFAAWQGNAGGYDAALGYVCHGSLHRRCLERNRCNKRFL